MVPLLAAVVSLEQAVLDSCMLHQCIQGSFDFVVASDSCRELVTSSAGQLHAASQVERWLASKAVVAAGSAWRSRVPLAFMPPRLAKE